MQNKMKYKIGDRVKIREDLEQFTVNEETVSMLRENNFILTIKHIWDCDNEYFMPKEIDRYVPFKMIERKTNTRADGWVSVEDRLPRLYQLVLLLTEDDNLYLSYFDTTKWIDSKGQDIDKKYKATHWMSLPEPPESEVNDE